MTSWIFRAITLALMAYVVWLLHVQARQRQSEPSPSHAVEVYKVRASKHRGTPRAPKLPKMFRFPKGPVKHKEVEA